MSWIPGDVSNSQSLTPNDHIYNTHINELRLAVDSVNSGDIVGPNTSTNDAIARFDGTTGKLIQNSDITIDDNNIISSTVSASSVSGPALNITQSNSTFNHFISYIESNQTTTLSNDTLRIVSNGGAVGSRGLFIKQNSDAAALIIDATGAPQTTVGSNMTVFNIDGSNTNFSMAKFVNHGISTSNNSNVFIQNLQATTQARTLQLDQEGTGAALYIDTNGTSPAVEIGTSKFGIKSTVDISGGYGMYLKTDGTATVSSSNGLAKFETTTAVDTSPVINIDNRSAGKSVYINNNGTEKLNIDANGKITSAATTINFATKTPSSASDTGTAGDIAWDSSFIYICVATNTWKRVAIATW